MSFLSESNGIRNHNPLLSKRTLSHLAKLAKYKSAQENGWVHLESFVFLALRPSNPQLSSLIEIK